MQATTILLIVEIKGHAVVDRWPRLETKSDDVINEDCGDDVIVIIGDCGDDMHKLTGMLKNGDEAAEWAAAMAAKPAADGPLSIPRLCMAAAWRIGCREAILIFSISASCNLLDFALRFWNHILTCVSVKLRLFENSALSAIDKYCFSLNFFSNAINCEVVKGVLGFLFGLCLLRVHLRGPNAGFGGSPEKIDHLCEKQIFLTFKGY